MLVGGEEWFQLDGKYLKSRDKDIPTTRTLPFCLAYLTLLILLFLILYVRRGIHWLDTHTLSLSLFRQ